MRGERAGGRRKKEAGGRGEAALGQSAQVREADSRSPGQPTNSWHRFALPTSVCREFPRPPSPSACLGAMVPTTLGRAPWRRTSLWQGSAQLRWH